MFDALLVQLRNLTISCSFLQIGTTYQPHVGLGYVPFNDLMLFLADATCGVYFIDLPEINDGYDNEINDYHKAFLTWGFQKDLEDKKESYFDNERNPFASESALRIRKRERKGPLRATLNAVLSCRLREGYIIKNVKLATDRIELILMLSWKYSITIEYLVHSKWPPTHSEVQTEVWTEGSYEFLNDVSSYDSNLGLRSHYRQRMVAKYLNTLQDLRETDLLLVNLQSFPSNPQYYTIPDCVQKGIPVFYLNSLSSNPVPSSDFHVQYPQFANFWLPICMLNINKWQKWMHTHRIGVILKHETPLPKNLHIPNSSGRYGTVHSRHSELTLTSFFASWTDFTLIENNSYIKYLYKEDAQTLSSFFVVRITSNRPPCLAIRIAFLGGTSCRIRSKIVKELEERLQQLTVRVRERSRERKSADAIQKSTTDERDQNVSSFLCCSITRKPIEKILIWHDRIPSNLFSSQVQETNTPFFHFLNARLGATNKFASENQALLCRYLHHRRWLWGLQSAGSLSVSISAIMRVLDTLTRMRLREGFKFAYSRNGIVTMIKEFKMKLDLHYNFGSSERHLDESDVTSYCMVQYIMFPPHLVTTKENVEDEADEAESVEADGESQLITECWVEPQNGVVQASSDDVFISKGLNFRQLASSFFPRDKECIWGLLTFEYLSQFCQDENETNLDTFGFVARNTFNVTPVEGANEPAIQQIPFQFQLTQLLPRCQRTEILLSTLIQDFYGHITNSACVDKNLDRANHLLYSLILDHLNQLHNGKQFHLSSYDNAKLPQVLAERLRDSHHGNLPFACTEYDNLTEAPKWRCFLKYISQKHFVITLIPSSFCDLKRLLLCRSNIINSENKAIQIIDQAECMELLKEESIMEGVIQSDITEEEISLSNTYSECTVSSPVTQRAKSMTSSHHHQSLASTSSNLSSRSSSIPHDKKPLNEKQLNQYSSEKKVAQRHPSCGEVFNQKTSVADTPKKSEELKRQRYRSGPSSSSQMTCPMESLDESFEPRRGRAYSLHSSTDGGVSQRPSRSSVSALSSVEKTNSGTAKEKKDTSWVSPEGEKLRKRNISLPSKCHTEMLNKSINNKSLSVEIMKEDISGIGSQTPLYGDIETSFQSSSIDSTFHQPPHEPIYGSVTLPIYCFDCKLNGIIDQYLNKFSSESQIVKDVYVDSTFKFGEETLNSCEANCSYPGVNTSHEAAADKNASPESLSEESDNLKSDLKCLKKFTESIEKCHRRSFVMGCFEALSNELFVHSFDVQAALDQCHEAFLETDITDYLQMICGHLKDFRMRFFVKKMEAEKYYSLGSHFGSEIQPSIDESPLMIESFPLSLLYEHQACQDLISVHIGIRKKFSDILQNQFRPVHNLQDYYYYAPKYSAYSHEENNKYKIWKLNKKIKKKSEEYFVELSEKDEDEDSSNEERNLYGEDEDFEKSIEFRSDGGSFVSHPRLFSQFSQISQLSQMSEVSMGANGDNADDKVVEDGGLDSSTFPPLFLHLTCTIRYQGQAIGTSSLGTLPTCLGDLASNFITSSLDLSKMFVTLEMLVMTLLGGAEIITEGLNIGGIDNPLRRRGRRTISGCSTTSSGLRLSESTIASNSGSEDMCINEDDILYQLPDDQHKAILITFEKIKWLMQDQIVSALLQCYPITSDTLQLVAAHVSDSYPAPNCLLEAVPLKFVFGMEQSMDKFMQEFKNLKIGRYHLEKVDNFYFLAVPHDYNRRRRICSVVPPLPLKRPSLDLRRKSSEDTYEPEDQIEGSPSYACQMKTLLSEKGGILKKPQKVSFEPNFFDTRPSGVSTLELISSEVNDTKEIILESSFTEVKKGKKWLQRRERKERRDSEKRGTLESSDSEEDMSPSSYLCKESTEIEMKEFIDSKREKRRSSFDICQKNKEKEVVAVDDEAQVGENAQHEIELQEAEFQKEKLDLGADVEIPEGENLMQKHRKIAICERNSDGQDKGVGALEEIRGHEETKMTEFSTSQAQENRTETTIPPEIVRCGSVSLPDTEGRKAEILRKSASTDEFRPFNRDGEICKDTPVSNALLGEILRNKYSNDGVKTHSELSKCRHNSGGELLNKSRHNSGGAASAIGLYSDVSSHVESEQTTTEDGCEGDISDSDECADWMQDFEIAQPPEFWIVITIAADTIQTFFHCRNENEFNHWKEIHEEVVYSLKKRVKLVNQQLLLRDLNDCRNCNHLLEPETPDDIWKHEDQKDLDSEGSEYLEAAMKFQLGAFACPEVWFKNFELHPRLKLTGKGIIKGIHTLKKTLNPFMVNNRKNMFVYEDSSGVGTNVFYLRLHEQQSTAGFSASQGEVNRRDHEALSRSNSFASSLSKKGVVVKEEDNTVQGDARRSFIEKDVIMEGVPSSILKKSQDHIVLSVHGIADPGGAIKEKLVQMLQKRLDDAVLDAICLTLWDNPHHKLTPEDVHFIQPPYSAPSVTLRFSVNPFALTYIPATCYYLRQNLISCGFSSPKYTDARPENHFQDFSTSDQDPSSEANIFLFVCSQKSGTKGVACLAFSAVDSTGSIMHTKGIPKFNSRGYEDLHSEDDFDVMTHTQQSTDDDFGAIAMFQFKVWESGRLDFDEIAKGLEEAIKHALWDLSMEQRFLMAPITPTSLFPGVPSLPSTPVKGGSGRAFGSPRSSYQGQDKLGSPLFLNQGNSRYKNSGSETNIANRRSSIQVMMEHPSLVETVPKTISKSPSKPRHSIDYANKEIILNKNETKLRQLNVPSHDIILDDNESYTEADEPQAAEALHFVFAQLMKKWFEFAVKLNVPSVKKHVIVCSTTSALPVLLVDLQRWLNFHLPDAITAVFRKNSENTYIKEEFMKINQSMKSERVESDEYDFVITNRNEKHWWTILFEKDFLEVTNQINKANKSMKHGSVCIPQHGTADVHLSESVVNSGYFSSPSSSQVLPFLDSTPTPTYSHQTAFKFGDSPSTPAFIHRQMFFIATLRGNELTVYSYNWLKDLNEMLHAYLNRLSQWTVARTRLLSSLVLQKMGLFHNQPFVRKDQGNDREATKKEEPNPFVQNLYYIEGLIKSVSPGRDSVGPNDRSGRRNQSQPSLHNLSEVLRDSPPPRPLHKQAPKKDLLQRHGIQMVEVTRVNIHKEREQKILLSTLQSEAAATPVFTEVTLTMLKKHARLVHFCLTPLLFLPKWRSEVATVRDHSLPNSFSSSLDSTSQGKANETRSRHESGASTKGLGSSSQLELRRSSSVGIPSSGTSSPTHGRKRHPTLGGEDKWHDALCLSYLKEFIQYLHCLGFASLCVPHSAQSHHEGTKQGRSSSGSGNRGREDSWRDVKLADQDISSPTYLIRQCIGGSIILQINFVEPYFSTMVYALEASRTQYPNIKNKSQCRNFIDEVMLIQMLLHMHSFTYDYHLRAVSAYVAHRQLLFARGYHLSSFLSDFIKYYNKSPNFARNLIYSGEVRIEETGTSGEQLYNYLLSREKEYEMRVLRMTPVLLDLTSDVKTEFILVHTKVCPINMDEECEEVDSRSYDVSLLVSHDITCPTSTVDYRSTNALDLKFYVVLTSRRDMYPNRNSESKTGRFRTVSFKNSGIKVCASGNSLTSMNSSTSKAPDSDPSRRTSVASFTHHMAIRQESVNYLGYYSEYEMYMQQILQQQVAEARERVLQIFNTAKIHCRRDSLWQRLIWVFRDEERMKSSKDQASGLSFPEFCELLSLVTVKSVSSMDPQLIPLVSQPVHWYQSLARLLSIKYQDSTSHGTRFLTSPDGNIQYVVAYNLSCPDACMMISHNLHTQRADICLVRKYAESDCLDSKVRPFLEDFVNCCCFHLWSGLV